MGDLVDGINEIQQAVVDAYGCELRLNSKLSRTIEGSLIGVQETSIESLDGKPEKKSNVLIEVQNVLMRFLRTPKSHKEREPFKKLTEDLTDVINDSKDTNPSTLHVTHLDEFIIAKATEKIINAINKKLSNDDDVFIGLGRRSEDPTTQIGKNVFMEKSVDDIYEKLTSFSHKKIALEISNAAFNGTTWRFKWLCKITGRQEFSAKITHNEWLDSWFDRKQSIFPGDGLRVNLTVDMNGKGRRVGHIIDYVHCIIPRNEMRQLQMSDSNNG